MSQAAKGGEGGAQAPGLGLFTVLVRGDQGKIVRRLQLSEEALRAAEAKMKPGAPAGHPSLAPPSAWKMWLRGMALVALVVLAALVGLRAGDQRYRDLAEAFEGVSSRNLVLTVENAGLSAQLRSVEERVDHVASTLSRVEKRDAELRNALNGMELTPSGAVPPSDDARSDPRGTAKEGAASTRTVREPVKGTGRNGSGGVEKAAVPVGSSRVRRDPPPAGAAATAPVEEGFLVGASPAGDALARLDSLASRQEEELTHMARYFETQRTELARTPNEWPLRGLVTSDFGARLDPYTADRVMHRGLDIVAPNGQTVFAPSDGTVTFAGKANGYGKVIILDHGFGLETRYGHLSRLFVKQGERVRRGERIGAVGSTGRSTGPHLHYEVRVNDVAENPRTFILD